MGFYYLLKIIKYAMALHKIIIFVYFFKTKKEKSQKLERISVLKNNTIISSMVEELEKSEMKKIKVLKNNEIKATKNILVIIVFFVLCWLVSEKNILFLKLILIHF